MHNIPGYRIEEQIYEGDNSLIYRGIREGDHAPVVLKMLRDEYPRPEEIARFRREHAMLGELRLDGVIGVHDMAEVGNRVVIVLEDFGGEALTGLIGLPRETFPLTAFLRLAVGIVRIVSRVHERNIIHKDINPANIVWNPETCEVKLIDFGISTELARETQAVLNPNVLEGTLAYMSPEQTGRMNRPMDYRTDLYSLGISFYQLLTGRAPFETEDSMEMVHCHIARMPAPPHEVDPGIPEPLSHIVMKLISKMAEDRYKSAVGLGADLKQCLDSLEKEGRIDPFPIGRHDIADKFQVSQRLYGREEETGTLLSAFDKVSSGGSALMLVAGYAGIGKSSLIEEIQKPIVKQRGYFISGKFDQYRQDLPYASLIQAFRQLVRYLLTESDEQIRRWKANLLSKLGENGRIIIDVIPELELITGPQPRVLELSGVEGRRRFNDLFERFLSVFCTREHPLVLFLDDLQWADPASLTLIEALMTLREEHYLLIVGAYRDNEVSPSHPLMLTLDAIGAKKKFETITLGPLSPENTHRLVADTLDGSLERTEELAGLVHKKTLGNPFFLTQLLTSMYDNRLLDFSLEERRWVWDIDGIKVLPGSDNVADLMVSKINKLPAETRELLMLGACLGNRFDLGTLSVIGGKTPSETAGGLWRAVREELIVPLDGSYGYIQWTEGEEATAVPPDAGYRFFHDRVHEAAYSRLSEERKKKTHLTIGRVLLANTTEENLSEGIFDIVNHLNSGMDLMTDRGERERLGMLNLIAGKSAKASAAYAAAKAYLVSGMDLLGEKGWENHYETMYDLYREGIECEFLCGNLEVSERMFAEAAQKTRTKRDTGRLYELMIRISHISYDYARGIELGKEGLLLFGIEIPDDPDAYAASLGAELAVIGAHEKERGIGELVDAPEMQDPDVITCCGIIHELWVCLFMSAHDQVLLPAVFLITLSLKHGQSSVTAVGHIFYALILSMQEDYDRAYDFGRLAMDLKEKYFNPLMAPKVHNTFCNFVNHYKNHVKTNIPIYEESYRYCVQSGEIWWGAWAATFIRTAKLVKGDPLEEVHGVGEKYADYIANSEFAPLVHVMHAQQAKFTNLMDLTGTTVSLDHDGFSEAETIGAMEAMPFGLGLFWHYVYKSFMLFLYEENEAALEAGAAAEENKVFIPGLMMYPDHFFFHSLIIAANYGDLPEEEKEEHLALMDGHIVRMAAWETHCPENFSHRLLLMRAERARITEDDLSAMALYDRATTTAGENGYLHHEAAANELAGKFYLEKGHEKAARGYLTEARHLYLRWGAARKVRLFDEKYPHLILEREEKTGKGTSTVVGTFTSKSLDLTSVMKASQAISGEIVMERLLKKLMLLLMENAGAGKGFLILEDGGELFIEAAGEVDEKEITVLRSIPVEGAEGREILPVSILQYVARTRENVVLEDAVNDEKFALDPYIASALPKSVLCAPILRQSDLAGILYLENNLATGAFTRERLEVLNLLSTQTAISLENAGLYANLEGKVRERTADLRKAHEKILVLEKEAVEMQMAGGFAHEMRNALVGSKLVIEQALGHDSPEPHVSMTLANSRTLKEIYTALDGSLDDALLGDILSRMRDIFANEEHLEEMLKVIYRSVSRGLSITQQIMDFSRIGLEITGGESIHMDRLMETIAAEFAPEFGAKEIEVRLVLDGGSTVIEGRESHFYSIVSNLLLNARDALLEKEEEERLVEVITGREEERYTLLVRDNGVGIPPEHISRIYEAFFSMKPETGTGLGLGVVKRIVSLYDGTIDVASEPGRGTTFTVSLPLGAEQNLDD